MALSDALLPEFDYEMANTRKTLERVPEDKFEWRPHEKSMTLGGLTTHLSNLPSWVAHGVNLDELDVAPEGNPLRVEQVRTRAEALETFDRNVAAARGDCGRERRAPVEALVTALERADGDELAARRHAARLRHESHDPPPRADERLSASE